MGHPYSVQPVIPANGVQNGSVITLVTEAGTPHVEKRAPDVNSFIDSGVLNTRTSGRFDEHYGGGAS